MNNRQILVTSALPYANGPIHLGHLVEYIQTISGSGSKRCKGMSVITSAPTIPTARRSCCGRKRKDPHAGDIDSPRPAGARARFRRLPCPVRPVLLHAFWETRQYAGIIYERLKAHGLIESRSIEQYYDPDKSMFLPDRFIKGECPRCHARTSTAIPARPVVRLTRRPT